MIPIANESFRAWREYGPGTKGVNSWPTFEEFTARIQAIANSYPSIVRMISLGKTVQGRDLWCLKISDYPDIEEDEPEFRYLSTMHGNEGVGTEMTIRLAEQLTLSYGSDPNLTNYVNEMEIWLCPIYNPDGYVNFSRYNAHGEELNRDFPDPITNPTTCAGVKAGCEPETSAYMNFGSTHTFVMGANYHTGALVVNYPWDGSGHNPVDSPDNNLYYTYSVDYARRNSMIWNGGFTNGVTEGWRWYTIRGGIQDWAYNWHGEHHVTIELSNSQPPPFSQMDNYWNSNHDAMIFWMGRTLTGVRGKVVDARNSVPLNATLNVFQNSRSAGMPVYTDPTVGDYHRMLLTGNYNLVANAAGYLDQSAPVSIISGTITLQDFNLCPSLSWAVSGNVTEAGSGQALAATVKFVGSPLTIQTNPVSGGYTVPVCPWTYTMRVSAPEHTTEERLVTVDSAQVQNFTLIPNAPPDFTLTASPASRDICSPKLASFSVTIGSLLGYNQLVTLTSSGSPPGALGLFTPNMVTPPGSSSLRIRPGVNSLPGYYSILISGTSPDWTHTTNVGLNLFNAVPGAVLLLLPANAATGVELLPTFVWSAATQGSNYIMQIAKDARFKSIVYSTIVSTTSHTLGTALNPLTQYFWRVRPRNSCGSGTVTPAFSFTTGNILSTPIIEGRR